MQGRPTAEIRFWMAKYDSADRQASGEPVPEEIQRLLGNLIASATSSGEVLDIYEAAGMPKPSLNDLTQTRQRLETDAGNKE